MKLSKYLIFPALALLSCNKPEEVTNDLPDSHSSKSTANARLSFEDEKHKLKKFIINLRDNELYLISMKDNITFSELEGNYQKIETETADATLSNFLKAHYISQMFKKGFFESVSYQKTYFYTKEQSKLPTSNLEAMNLLLTQLSSSIDKSELAYFAQAEIDKSNKLEMSKENSSVKSNNDVLPENPKFKAVDKLFKERVSAKEKVAFEGLSNFL